MNGSERINGHNRIRRRVRWLRKKIKPEGVILMYHRVIDLIEDPFVLAVSPSNFAHHLEYIQKTCHPMRLLDMAEAIEQKALPPRAVAITFDDGYADNFRYAFPLLQAAKIPATIFVTGNHVDSLREFWWDEMERIFLAPNQLPPHLQINIQGQDYNWPTITKQERKLAHQTIHRLIKPMLPQDRDNIVSKLVEWAGLSKTGRSDNRAMTTDELLQITQGSVVELGAHTMAHPSLAYLSPEEQHNEITKSRQRLEAIIDTPIHTIAYPYGSPDDFSDETVKIVKDTGFRLACTTVHGSIDAGDDLFRLRRCAVFDWDADTFADRLESFFVT